MNGKGVAYVFAGLVVLGGVGEGSQYVLHDAFAVAATQPGGPKAPQAAVSPGPVSPSPVRPSAVCATVPVTAKPVPPITPCPQATAKPKLHIHAHIPVHHVPRVHRILRVVHPRYWFRHYARGF